MINPYRIIIRPVVTEKSSGMAQSKRPGSDMPLNQYSFEVSPDANKNQIREAIEAWWMAERGVPIKVSSVNTMTVRGKIRRTRNSSNFGCTARWKKAVVTLQDGDSMDIY